MCAKYTAKAELECSMARFLRVLWFGVWSLGVSKGLMVWGLEFRV